MAAFRGADILLPWNVRHCLRLLAQASGGREPSDEIASAVLSTWLQQEHPDLWAWVAKREQDEADMVQQLAGTAPAPAKRKGAV